jgi:hypothetical protein
MPSAERALRLQLITVPRLLGEIGHYPATARAGDYRRVPSDRGFSEQMIGARCGHEGSAAPYPNISIMQRTPRRNHSAA